jgi:hypothetical protein
MPQGIRETRTVALTIGIALSMAGVAMAQQGPVTAMFAADQQRDTSLASSFATVDLPATGAGSGQLRVLLSAGDLERAFDRAEFRPDAAIVPTNTDLQISAASPGTQRVLITRVQQVPDAMRALESQVAARRAQASAATRGEPGLLRIGLDHFVARLLPASATASPGAFPKVACLVATDYADGGAVDRRGLFVQDRMRQGIAACLDALDTTGARSLVVPQMGAGSAKLQSNDAAYEGQRTLKECRLINSTAAIALGIHDFAARRKNLREIGVVQWDQEIVDMFKVPAGSRAERTAQIAYGVYAEQVASTLRRGLAGQKTTAGDLNGGCAAVLNGQ